MQKKLSFFLSAISGILLSLPWIFPGQSWTLFFAFCPLLFAEDQLARQKDGRISQLYLPAFLTFLIWNLLSTWWIAHVSLVGMLLITELNATVMASVWWSSQLVSRKLGLASSTFSLIVFWLAFEFVQHNWAIPWPWLTLGNGFANSVEIVQWYEFTGILGGSLWILLSNFLVYSTIKNFIQRSSFLKSIKFAGLALLVVIIPLFGSLYLYANYTEKGKLLEVLILQPNIDPYKEKFSGMSSEEQINRLLALAESNLTGSVKLVVAPETAWPPLWEDSIFTQNQSLIPLSEIIQSYPEVNFIVGAITQRKFGDERVISETAQRSPDGSFYFDAFNSALMIDQNQEIKISHKSILVNGVERMPFQKYFSFLSKYLLHLGGTNSSLAVSGEPVLFSVNTSGKIGPVICFESAFGEYCSNLVKRGTNLLVVITNDGWWRKSPGGWQHFGYSRLRAIETRRTLVRSANTGISGFINQRGEVLLKTGLNSYEAIRLSVRMNDKITFYVRYGDFLGRICLVLSGLTVLYLMMRYRNGKDKKNPH
ncbi:MAG TPA: apolipoprotein N-acyltransferase [Prolixibacteraceae bacterium]|nr:apolipoprotein N-acyltransferase [Prolixibacteraceae bacterium]